MMYLKAYYPSLNNRVIADIPCETEEQAKFLEQKILAQEDKKHMFNFWPHRLYFDLH